MDRHIDWLKESARVRAQYVAHQQAIKDALRAATAGGGRSLQPAVLTPATDDEAQRIWAITQDMARG